MLYIMHVIFFKIISEQHVNLAFNVPIIVIKCVKPLIIRMRLFLNCLFTHL